MLIYLQMIDSSQDKSKFEDIYITYRGLMFYVAKEILHNEQDAEDAVHQNKAIDIYRKRQRISEVELQEEINGIQIEYQGENKVAECMIRLPARYREVILLRYYHGYSTKEVAKALGISEVNTSKLLQRAKNKLEEFCREEGLLR